MLDFMKEMIEQDAVMFTSRGKELLFINNDEANLYTLELAKKFIVEINDKPDEDTPIEALALYKYEPDQVLQMIKEDKYPEDVQLAAKKYAKKEEQEVIQEPNKETTPQFLTTEQLGIFLAKKKAKNVETRSLPEDTNDVNTLPEVPEETESTFKYIEGFPTVENAKPEQIQANELNDDLKAIEANKGYVSEMFTDKFIKGLKKTEINLIGAETDSGKTTAIFEKLVPYAEKHGENVLLLINRTILRKQLVKEYAEGMEDKPLIKISDTLTIGMYQSINAKISFDIPVSELIESKFDYVVLDEFHSLYDDSDFNYKSYLFFNYLNGIESTIIALTGTPSLVDEMQEFLNKPINPLREPDRTNNKVENIYIVDNMDKFRIVQNSFLEKGSKVLELNSWVERIEKTKEYFSSKYKAAGLISQSHDDFEKYKNPDDEAIRTAIIEQEKMCCNVLATTKFMDVGINIKADTNFLVSYNCTEMPNTMEQYRSRVRFDKESEYHVDLLIRVLSKQSMKMKMKNIRKEIDTCNKLMEKYGSFENIMKHNPANNLEGFEDKSKVDDWERFNPVRMKYLNTKYNFFKKVYDSKDNIQLVVQKSKKMYPQANIQVIDYTDLFDVEGYFNGLLNGSNIVNLPKEKKERIKNDLKVLRLDKRQPNRKVGLDKIKDLFKEKNLPFEINNGRPYINGVQQSAWILKRKVID